MKRFLTNLVRGVFIVTGLGVLIGASPSAGTLAALIVALICGFALFRPVPVLGFGSRIYSGVLIAVVGLIILPVGVASKREAHEAYLAELKGADPSAYLAELEHSDPELWYRELKALDWERYEDERARRRATWRKKMEAQIEERAARRAAECGEGNSTNAYIYSQYFVEDSLKSPSTADFPSIHSGDEVGASPIGNCIFEVVAYVDSQNSFGATVRTRYLAKMKRLPEKESWRLMELTFLPN